MSALCVCVLSHVSVFTSVSSHVCTCMSMNFFDRGICLCQCMFVYVSVNILYICVFMSVYAVWTHVSIGMCTSACL